MTTESDSKMIQDFEQAYRWSVLANEFRNKFGKAAYGTAVCPDCEATIHIKLVPDHEKPEIMLVIMMCESKACPVRQFTTNE